VAREAARVWAASEGSVADGEDFNRIVDFLDRA
jgi:3-hydroxyisobutyrate dehydrogenase